MDYPGDSSEVEALDSNMHLLHVASLEMNAIKDKQNAYERDEWWEVLQVDSGSLHSQLDTGAYASVVNRMQLKQVAPNAQIKKKNQEDIGVV